MELSKENITKSTELPTSTLRLELAGLRRTPSLASLGLPRKPMRFLPPGRRVIVRLSPGGEASSSGRRRKRITG